LGDDLHAPAQVDVLVIGGGINGVGIARDAAGRGLSVMLVEQDDLASATSSASSKLIHGGLRYLEHYEFRLVQEALAEREVLLGVAPHLVHPMRFVMPHMPELRPVWVIRAGLFLYDFLSRRQTLPGSHAIDLRAAPYCDGLEPGLAKGFVYSDCWVDDARLVIANARSADQLGAHILTRTSCVNACREGRWWRVLLRNEQGVQSETLARTLVNAGGPWVKRILAEVVRMPTSFGLKLVKGSHIVVPRLYSGEHAFILQNTDRRVVFAYPYEHRYTLIGTTDVALSGAPGPCSAGADEIDYLCRAVNLYFSCKVTPHDVVWSYCGIRPLFDDGSSNPSAVTRDYMLRLDGKRDEAPLLSVFGGKITTYRKLAEHALARLAPWFSRMRADWTEKACLPGGDLEGENFTRFASGRLQRDFPWLPGSLRMALAYRHGKNAYEVLGEAANVSDLGQEFGADLYAIEVDYFMHKEWARTADDVQWRRTKAGLHLTPAQKQALSAYVMQRIR
jgi:glycerol-3-phosphate dehydrogenase